MPITVQKIHLPYGVFFFIGLPLFQTGVFISVFIVKRGLAVSRPFACYPQSRKWVPFRVPAKTGWLSRNDCTRKAAVGRKRRRMRGFQHQMIRIVKQRLRLAGVTAPEQKDDRLILFVEHPDQIVRKFLPADFEWESGLPCSTVIIELSSSTPCAAQSDRLPVRYTGT